MTPEEFRRFGHELIDRIADYRAGIAARPVAPSTEPGAVRAALPATPPSTPEPFENVLADLERLIVPNIVHWQHPRFFGYFPSNSLLSGVLGDLASTGYAALGLSWQASPALTELEEVTVDWVRRATGLPDTFRGAIQDTASTSTLLALICARERASHFALDRGGLQAEPRPLVVYVSSQSHSSVEKAALLADFGRANITRVAHDADHAMRPDALAEAIAADRRAGRVPCAIVATTGTTASTAIDPVGELAAIAQREGAWLHVDAAMAGSAMILPECRGMWAGIEGADSLVLNVHKWLGVPFDCSLFYARDTQHLLRVMSTNPSYLQSSADGGVINYRDWGIPLGRRFRALKLWFVLRSEGLEGLQARLRRDLAGARWLADQIAARPGWKLVAPVPLQTLCVRHEPEGLTGESLDRHTLDWANRVNRSGDAYLTPAQLDGRWMVRISVGSMATRQEDIERLWEVIQREAEGGFS